MSLESTIRELREMADDFANDSNRVDYVEHLRAIARELDEVSERVKECRYCDGKGNSSAGGACGFCDRGVPLDTQADWDASWGALPVRQEGGTNQ